MTHHPAIVRQNMIFASNLRPSERLLLLALSDAFGKKECWRISQEALAQRTGLGRQSVNYWLRRLVLAGIVIATGKHNTSLKYRFDLDGHFTSP